MFSSNYLDLINFREREYNLKKSSPDKGASIMR
jgi:hypothetical protein